MHPLSRLALSALFALSAAQVAAAPPWPDADWPIADAGASG
nr:hypothetical protein [Luteimonas sp. XNQY3]